MKPRHKKSTLGTGYLRPSTPRPKFADSWEGRVTNETTSADLICAKCITETGSYRTTSLTYLDYWAACENACEGKAQS